MLTALSPPGLLQISMQIPSSQPFRECNENSSLALGCGGFCACWGAAVGMQILFSATQQRTVAF